MPTKYTNRNYLPTTETEAYLWLTNLAQQLPSVANLLGIGQKVTPLVQAAQLLTDTHRYQQATRSLAEERTANKNEAAWNPIGQHVYVRPTTTDTGPQATQSAEAGAYPLAIALCDDILSNRSGKLDQAIKDLLRLNPLPKHLPGAVTGTKPQYEAYIDHNQLTIKLTKAGYQYFMVKIDHGTGEFDAEHVVHESPFKDPTPLPTDTPQMWRVQVFGYAKGNHVGIPGDIIDVAAKAYLAEHSEGTG
ncbi:hypothetical protein [Geminisphaera colitermitum]|uniref:hypothetical protein n=1 Tax=Geminisphaera colitermitum TaxID=1148786 RepID=UPI000158D064|nr:hypothetical protein [Geminisphaera colitermitum]